MAVTRPSDIIFSPSLVADLVDGRMYNGRVGKVLASPYVEPITGIEPNKSGKTIDIPYYKEVSGNSGVQTWSGSAFTPDKLQLDSVSATINTYAVNFENDLVAWNLIANSDNPEDAMASYVARKAQEKLFTLILAAIEAKVTEEDISHASAPTSANYLSYTALDKHATKSFGDSYNGDENPLLVIGHSKALYDFRADSKVQTAIQYTGRNISENPWTDAGAFRLFNSDMVTKSGSGSTTDYYTYLLKEGAIKIYTNMLDVPDTGKRKSNTLDIEHMFAFQFAVAVNPEYDVPVSAIISNSSLS